MEHTTIVSQLFKYRQKHKDVNNLTKEIIVSRRHRICASETKEWHMDCSSIGGVCSGSSLAERRTPSAAVRAPAHAAL
jgi:hypothetical protein